MSRRICLCFGLAVVAVCLGLSPPEARAAYAYEVTIYDSTAVTKADPTGYVATYTDSADKGNDTNFSWTFQVNPSTGALQATVASTTGKDGIITAVVSVSGYTTPPSGSALLSSNATWTSAGNPSGSVSYQGFVTAGPTLQTSATPTGTSPGALSGALTSGAPFNTASGNLGQVSTDFTLSSPYTITSVSIINIDCEVTQTASVDGTTAIAAVTTPAPVGGILFASGLPMMLLGGLFLRRKGQPLAV